MKLFMLFQMVEAKGLGRKNKGQKAKCKQKLKCSLLFTLKGMEIPTTITRPSG